MTPAIGNEPRVDPYGNVRFRVTWNGRGVAGFSKVSALKRSTEVIEHREGGDSPTAHQAPHRTEFEAITLERGVTHDPEFEKWAHAAARSGADLSLEDVRRDPILEVYNETGQFVLAYRIYRCWVSEFQALPDLDANANLVAIQSITLEHEGWERDDDVTEAADPNP
jgi:phage tail-like protein